MTSMIATEYKTRLKYKEKCSDSAMAFYFDKPPGFQFEAGQYIDLTLIDPPETDPDGSIRCFPGRRASGRAPTDCHKDTRHGFRALTATAPHPH
jgi:hypothetical protein